MGGKLSSVPLTLPCPFLGPSASPLGVLLGTVTTVETQEFFPTTARGPGNAQKPLSSSSESLTGGIPQSGGRSSA